MSSRPLFRTHIGRSTAVVLTTLGVTAVTFGRVLGAQTAAPARPQQTTSGAVAYAYTPADVRFMTMMIGHHGQAIVMSRMAPSHGASPAVQRLADRIINAQQDEIGTMQRWLRERGQPVPPGPPAAGRGAASAMHSGMPMDGMAMGSMPMDGMAAGGAARHPSATPATPGTPTRPSTAPGATAHGDPHATLMPGMLTGAQMAQLDRARGAEFDRLFLTYMIQHHRGAVGMVDDLFASYGAGQDETVFKFASDVHVDQTTEIARMQQMLAGLLLGDA